MKPRRAILIAGSSVVLLLGAALLASPTRLFFRLNRLEYLLKDRRFLEAMREWDSLVEANPGARERRPDFERRVIHAATSYYLSPVAEQAGGPGADELDLLLQRIAERPDLARMGRRLQLRLSLHDGRSTSPTLAAAAAVLENEGFDLEALWWFARSRYDPRHPLDVPPELAQFRRTLLQPTTPGTIVSREDAVRNLYLRALIALSDRDWARAAYLLEHYSAEDAWLPEDNLPLGIALLKSGRADAAVGPLLQYLRSHPDDTLARSRLLESYVRQRSSAWAAATFDALRAIDDAAAAAALASACDLRIAPGEDAIVLLARELAASGPRFGDIALWRLLDRVAPTGSRRAAVDLAAEALIDASLRDPAAVAPLLAWTLRQPPLDAVIRLTDALNRARSEDPSAHPAPRASVSPEVAGRAISTLLEIPSLIPAPAPLVVRLNNHLTRNTTIAVSVNLPEGASLLALHASGYVAQGVWPVLHVDLGPLGNETFYVADPDGGGIWLLMPLTQPTDQALPAVLTLSLLNATPAEDRQLYAARVTVF
jgi:hypothetical protein